MNWRRWEGNFIELNLQQIKMGSVMPVNESYWSPPELCLRNHVTKFPLALTAKEDNCALLLAVQTQTHIQI